MGSGDRPYRVEGSITSGPPLSGHELLQDPVIHKIANRTGRTPAQVVLRWHVQMGGTAICKSVTPERIRDNYK